METYISLLRGINVSGKNKIKMAELSVLYSQLGLTDVKTYIQSGNVIFNSKENNIPLLEQQIKDKIQTDFGYDVKITIKKANLIYQITAKNPYLNQRKEDIKFLHVTFLSDIPDASLVEAIKDLDYKSDEFSLRDDLIFVFTPGGYGKTKLSNNFFERKLKVAATTRNWKTILKLKELVQNFEE